MRVTGRVFWQVAASCSRRIGEYWLQYGTRDLTPWLLHDIEDLSDEDALLALLEGMQAAFLWPDYRKNIRANPDAQVPDFEARMVLRTRDGGVKVTIEFRRGWMFLYRKEGPPDPHVTVIFEDGKALRTFILRENILDALMADEVTVEDNLDYAWRFMFLVRDLVFRLQGTSSLAPEEAKARAQTRAKVKAARAMG
jgi:hypothetical protein